MAHHSIKKLPFLILGLLLLFPSSVLFAVETYSYAPEAVFADEYGYFAFELTLVAGDSAGPFGGFEWHGVENVSGLDSLPGDCEGEPLVPGQIHQFTVYGFLDSLFSDGIVSSSAWDCTQAAGEGQLTNISFETVEASPARWTHIKSLYR